MNISWIVGLFALQGLMAGEITIPKRTPFVWHPFLIEEEEDAYLLNLFHRPFLQVEMDSTWGCKGCRTFEMVSQSRPIRFDVVLGESWRWSDGKPVSVQDFLLSWEIAAALRKRNRVVASWQEIASITPSTTQPTRMELQMARPVYPYHFLGALYLLPAHQEGPIWQRCQKNVACYLQQSGFQTRGNWVSAGPYRMESVVGEVATLVPNPYALRAPLLAVIRLLRGKISKEGAVFWPETAFSPWTLQEVDLAGFKHVTRIPLHTYALEQISFNLRSPLLRDVQVRKALLTALDVQKLVGDLGIPALSFTHPADPFFSTPSSGEVSSGGKKEGPLLAGAEQARLWLRQANWKENRDGFFYKQDRKLTFELVVTSDRAPLAKRLQLAWRKSGVDVQILVEKQEIFQQEVLGNGQFSGSALYALHRLPNYSVASLFDSNREPHGARRNSGFNLFRWSSLRMDQWSYQFDRQVEEVERKKHWLQLDEMLREDIPMIPLYFQRGQAASTVNLQLDVLPPFVPTSMGVEKWTVR
jgi:peptide/nickel transport system substrate-binding protein